MDAGMVAAAREGEAGAGIQGGARIRAPGFFSALEITKEMLGSLFCRVCQLWLLHKLQTKPSFIISMPGEHKRSGSSQ
jgi:hypothetical protein